MNSSKKSQQEAEMPSLNPDTIKYVPLGDSYTIGNGVLEEERWPNVLVQHLRKNGIKVELVENPAVSGFKVKDVIDHELPVLQEIKPAFVTILIGANDNFQRTSVENFATDYNILLNQIEKTLPAGTGVLLIAIPDYTSSPAAKDYPQAEKIKVRESLKQYNEIIKNEAKKRSLEFIDIFPLSQTMTVEEYYVEDGLHPSSKGYALWESLIFPQALKILKK